MTFQMRRTLPLIALSLLLALGMALGVPASARADALSWARTYAGPEDVRQYPLADMPVAGAFNAVSFADATHGWAVGVSVKNPGASGQYSSLICATDDGGATWLRMPISATVQLYGVFARSATDVWAVGGSGYIAHLEDGVWVKKTVPTALAAKTLRAIVFTDANLGWVVGDGGAVARTTNGGSSWSVVTAPGTAPALRGVARVSDTTAVAVGDGGTIKLLSGTQSSPRSSGTSSNLYGVSFADSMHGWVVGNDKVMRATVDGGASWTPVGLPALAGFTASQLDLRAVAFADADTGIAVGAYQTVYRTFDGGANWALERLTDPGTGGDLELRGAVFAAGSADDPVTVGRPYAERLTSSDHKARAYVGAWSDRVQPPPSAPTAVAVTDGGSGSAGPRIRVTWRDNSGSEDGFVLQRAQGTILDAAFQTVATLGAGETAWIDAGVDWDSTWYYRVKAYRGELSSAWALAAGYRVDSAPPVTTSDAAGAYVGTATITLSADDGASGSGVADTLYVLDAQHGSGTTIQATGTGQHTLQFWSVDAAGNHETPRTVTFTIADPDIADSAAPVTTSGAVALYMNSALISISATDGPGGAGVAHNYYRLDAGSQVESSTVRISTAGAHTLYYWSVDAMGNVETARSVKFTVLSGSTPSTPSTPSSVKRGRSFTTYGYLVKHTAGTYPVTLRFYRYRSGSYVYYKSVTAKASTVLTFSKYSRSTSVPYSGKWRVRAAHKVGTKYLYSSYRYFTAY